MNVRTLLDNFDLIADAPGGVPKLRDLILHFAFTGQLLSKTTTWQTKPLKSVATKIGSGSGR